MLSEKQIEALKAGAYGVTRDGYKAKYIGVSSRNYHCWAIYDGDGTVGDVLRAYKTFHIYDLDKQDSFDIVGLWEDKLEPFNLERALNGEPIVREGIKHWLIGQSKFEPAYLIIEDEKGRTQTWLLQGLERKFFMWKEPEQVKPSVDDLPRPIREFGDLNIVWYIKLVDGIYEPNPSNKGANWNIYQKADMNNGCYYATEEDCRKICDWLMNR